MSSSWGGFKPAFDFNCLIPKKKQKPRDSQFQRDFSMHAISIPKSLIK